MMDRVTKKALSGFCALFIVMSLALFLSAWTVRYWQAWLFLAVFFIPVVFITLDLFKHDKKLLERRVSAGMIAETRIGQKIIQAFANVFFIGLIVLPGIDHRFHWSNISNSIIILADVFILIGFTIVHCVFKANTFTSATIEIDKEQIVISSGLYGIVRHPMYLGGLIIVVFMPLALGSYWALYSAFPLIIAIIARLLDEEKYLKKDLKGYEEYCLKVKHHLIPFVW
jgi:protein-S-isoprenylcysteine O-methyltransferase Ste14